jgi:glycerol-3-phosphate O-acyltransferase
VFMHRRSIAMPGVSKLAAGIALALACMGEAFRRCGMEARS